MSKEFKLCIIKHIADFDGILTSKTYNKMKENSAFTKYFLTMINKENQCILKSLPTIQESHLLICMSC